VSAYFVKINLNGLQCVFIV